MKIDFPKIPFVESKEKFLEFSELGSSLISLHLLQDNTLDSHIGYLKKDKIIESPATTQNLKGFLSIKASILTK